MKKIKIAVISTHPIQYFCPLYHSWLKLENIDFLVFFASSAGYKPIFDKDFGKEIKWDNIGFDFPHKFLNNGKILLINSKLDAPELAEELDIYKPDVIINYGLSSKYQLRAYKWALNNNKEKLMMRDTELRGGKRLITKLKRAIILPKVFKNFDGFLTVGDANEDFYKRYNVPAQKLFRSPFPIDVLLYNELFLRKIVIRENVLNKYNLTEDSFIISVVGKLTPRKNQIELIRAIKELNSTFNKIILFVIGSGEMELECKREAKNITNNKVIFTGFMQPNKIAEIYFATDIYIHTSKNEPYGIVMAEAAYTGCPLIVSDKCGSYGPTSDVQVGKNGFVYPSGNFKELARYIELLIRNEDLRHKFSKNSRLIGERNQRLAHKDGLINALTGIGLL